MTKAELIRAISKRAGIPDVNAKLFFEVLLKRLSEILQAGQAVDFSGIGFLQLRKGKLQVKEQIPEDTSADSYLNLIVYYPNADEPDVKNLIFNIPDIDAQLQDTIEQSFSLSIGKPVIPLEGVKETDYFTPLTGKELKDLVSSRVETLLSELNIIRDYAKGSEVLLITPTKFSRDQFEIKWDDLSVDDDEDVIKTEPSTKDEKLKTTEKIEWEFGSELNKQIEEEAILDTDKDEVSLVTPRDKKTTKGDIDWNFGITQEDIPQTVELPITEEKLEDDDDIQKSPIKDENVTDETIEQIDTVEDKAPKEEEPEYQKIDTLYNRLKAQRGMDTDEFNLTWSFGETQQIEPSQKEIRDEIPKAKHFPERPIEKEILETPKVDKTKSITDEIIEDKISTQQVIEEEGISKDDQVIITRAKPTITKEEVKKKKTLEKLTSTQKRRTYQQKGTYSKRGVSIPFFIGIFVIILVGVFLFSMLSDKNLDFLNLTEKETPKINKTLYAGTNIIERNYDIPVSFTSDKNYTNLVNQPLKVKSVRKPSIRKTSVKKPSKKIISENKKIPVIPLQTSRIKELRESMNDVVTATKNKELNITPKKKNEDVIDPNEQFTFDNLPPPIDTPKLHSNIYKDGNTYTVQVSSWKYLTTAEKEVSKFKLKGFDAFVAKALIPGKGLWYRVRVRNFKTIKEAEDFLLLYQ